MTDRSELLNCFDENDEYKSEDHRIYSLLETLADGDVRHDDWETIEAILLSLFRLHDSEVLNVGRGHELLRKAKQAWNAYTVLLLEGEKESKLARDRVELHLAQLKVLALGK